MNPEQEIRQLTHEFVAAQYRFDRVCADAAEWFVGNFNGIDRAFRNHSTEARPFFKEARRAYVAAIKASQSKGRRPRPPER